MTDNNNRNTTTGSAAANDGDDDATISVSKAVMRSSTMCDILNSLSEDDRTAASMFIERLLGDFDSILTAYRTIDASNAKR